MDNSKILPSVSLNDHNINVNQQQFIVDYYLTIFLCVAGIGQQYPN